MPKNGYTGRGQVRNPNDKRLKANRPPKPVEQKTRLQQLIDGDITVEDLDDEEIVKGRPRNRAGKFDGRPPKMLPRQLVTSMQVEFKRRIQQKFDDHAEEAIAALREIMNDKRAQAQARVNAANLMLERVVGKVPDQVLQEVMVREFEDFKGVLIDVEDEVAAKRAEKAG